MIKEYNLVAYIGKNLSISMVASGKVLPVFATEGERMDQAGFKRIGAVHVVVTLDEDPEAEDMAARVAAAGSVA